jgi:hypothetical protein
MLYRKLTAPVVTACRTELGIWTDVVEVATPDAYNLLATTTACEVMYERKLRDCDDTGGRSAGLPLCLGPTACCVKKLWFDPNNVIYCF